MEREELEQVPWSSLATRVDRRGDRRWYALGALVACVVVAVVGVRYLATPGQPSAPPVADATVALPSTAPQSNVAPGGTLVIAEDDLRTDGPPDRQAPSAVAVRAEWFVMDYFTHDGSEETTRSVREALVPSLRTVPLPHDGGRDTASTADSTSVASTFVASTFVASTFVEWARVLDVAPEGGGSFVATVAYRSIRGEDGGFVRDPVAAVSLTIVDHEGSYLVATLPSPTALPARLRPEGLGP
jgi:hypothetical protein